MLSAAAGPVVPRVTTTRGWTCAHHAFEASAAATPHAPAVAAGGRAATYAEVDRHASAVAARLRALGVGPERRVVVLMEPGPAFAAALLGVLKAGGAYVPIDPEYPAGRIAWVLQDSGAAAVLTHADAAHRLPPTALPVVDVDAVELAPADGFEAADADADNLAYVIYTSGSTGRPKGVGVTHRSLVSLQRVAVDIYGMTGADRVGQLPSVGFDMSVEPIWAAWAAGAALLFRPRAVPALGPGFWRWVEDERITILNPPTALWHAWVADMAASGARVPASVRLLITGGEKPQAAALARWRQIAPEVRWMNCYGPTEATVWATTWELPASGWEGDAPIGRERANARAWVVGDDGRLAAEGEVCVGGVAVARGYLGRAALTAERFVPDPFADRPGARMYRTGDRARWREVRGCESAKVREYEENQRTHALTHSRTSVLEFLGRVDDQVKVGGYRVEPGEVEAVLAEHPHVAAAAVAARRGAEGAARLHGWAVLHDGAAADASALRRWLRGRLPAYMVPSTLTLLPALPLNANGKVDRRALATPSAESPESPETAGDGDDTTRAVAEIWREVLGVAVSPDDDFFEAGGHSLLGMLVLSRVRRRWGVELPVRALFEARTPAALAARIDAAAGTPADPQPPLVRVPRNGRLPASFAQERLWFLHQMEPLSPFYNIPTCIRLSGAVDADALRRALAEVVRRHEALRTTFRETPGGAVQVIHPAGDGGEGTGDGGTGAGSFPLPLHDLSGHPFAEEEARRIAADAAAAPFDLSRDAMLRGRLVRTAPDEHLLVLVLHHVAGDAWSLGVLLHEMAAAYAAFVAGEPSPLGDLPLQYADFAAWQRAWLSGGVLDAQLGYWRARLAGAPAVLELPADHPRPAVPSHRGAVVRFDVPPALAARLRQAARRHDATPYMVLLAGFQLLLHRLSGRDDLVVGTPVAGGRGPQKEGRGGLFLKTLALRSDLSGDLAHRGSVAGHHQATLEAYARQDLPFERVVEELHPARSMSRNPLFQVAFAMENVPRMPAELPGVRMRLEEVDAGTSKFDLFLEMYEADGRFRGALEYATDLWEPASARRMAALYLRLLDALAGDADRPLSAAAAAGAAEVAAWNRTAREYPRDAAIHARFAAVARGRADAVALAWDGGEMTYAELDARSSRLANLLVRRGARPDQPVALLLERSPALVVAILGILKAGGAYLPLDPRHPRARIAAMLDDAGARLVVTESPFIPLLPDHPPAVVRMDDGAMDAEPAAAPGVAVSALNAAYVMYTSGSTGRPKGVVVPHRAVLRLATDGGFAETGPGETWLQMAPAAFDAATLELWAPLLNGGRVALHPPGTPDPAELGAFIRRHGVTSAWLTAALFHHVVDHDAGALGGLRQLLAGGDVLSPAHVRRALDADPHLRLINGYGPTENTTFSCCHAVARADLERASIPIGIPISNSTAYVLDAAMRPAPVDVPGELYVGGDGVARGYLAAPALTAERFVPDPFAADGSRLYRTGDRARWRETEVREEEVRTFFLEFLGRLDAQAKIRGHRVEPGEVEAVLARHPAVSTAAAVVREDAPGQKRLVAYAVPAAAGADRAALARGLMAFAREQLPEPMAPAAIAILDALPLTAAGKVDRAALPAPEPVAAAGAEPATATERRIAQDWAALLRVERVPADAPFFALGGHSLLAAQLAARIRDEFGVSMPLPALLAAPTVAGMAAAVDAELAGLRAEVEAELGALSDDEVLALLADTGAWDRAAEVGG